MNRKKMIGLSVAGVLVVGILALGVFVFMQRTAHANGAASGPGPGMMFRGGGGQSSAPGGLTAVTAQGTPIPALTGGAKLPENTATQKVGNLNVKLALSPYPPVSFSQADFSVTLTDENGQPVTDASISLDLTMPSMPMPSNVLNPKHTAQGVYPSAGRFTMRGWWRIAVQIQRAGIKQSAFFDVWL